jgi:hypothetical protein
MLVVEKCFSAKKTEQQLNHGYNYKKAVWNFLINEIN